MKLNLDKTRIDLRSEAGAEGKFSFALCSPDLPWSFSFPATRGRVLNHTVWWRRLAGHCALHVLKTLLCDIGILLLATQRI